MNSGSFKKGHEPWNKGKTGFTPWNKGKRGYMGANRTSFTRETMPHQAEIGKPASYSDKHSGVVCAVEERVRVKDARTGKVYMHHRRTSYARYVLNQAGIEIPTNCVVYHKDGDFENNELSNLEVISRSELIRRNRA